MLWCCGVCKAIYSVCCDDVQCGRLYILYVVMMWCVEGYIFCMLWWCAVCKAIYSVCCDDVLCVRLYILYVVMMCSVEGYIFCMLWCCGVWKAIYSVCDTGGVEWDQRSLGSDRPAAALPRPQDEPHIPEVTMATYIHVPIFTHQQFKLIRSQLQT